MHIQGPVKLFICLGIVLHLSDPAASTHRMLASHAAWACHLGGFIGWSKVLHLLHVWSSFACRKAVSRG